MEVKMKFLYIFLPLLLSCSAAIQSDLFAQMYYLDAKPARIKYIDSTLGWIVGEKGTIYKTSDGGENWSLKQSGTQNNLYDIAFEDEFNGIAIGHSVVLSTSDGGENWNSQPFDDSVNVAESFSGVYYLGGPYSLFCKSTDKGATWVKSRIPVLSAQLRNIAFINKDTGLICVHAGSYDDRILKTTDGGVSWIQKFSNASSFHYLKENFVTGYNQGAFYRTTDFGESWALIWKYDQYPNLYQVQFVNENFGVALQGSMFGNYYMFTEDGGYSWQLYNALPKLASYPLLQFSSRQKGTLTSNLNTYRTTDGGNSWIEQSARFEYSHLVYFSDSSTGYRFGQRWIPQGSTSYRESAIQKTIDGGVTWKTKHFDNSVSGGNVDVDGKIRFLNKQKGIAVVGAKNNFSSLGKIFLTSDGGETWALVHNSAGKLNSFSFVDSLNYIAVGDNGLLLKSTDGGFSWNIKESGTTVNLNGISFNSIGKGVAVGEGTILTSSDAGNSWNSKVLFPTVIYNDVFFINQDDVTAAGTSGIILLSQNGGNDWKEIDVSTAKSLNAISFTDTKAGMVVGTDGVVLKTANGGLSWSIDIVAEGSGILSDVSFVDRTHAYVCGFTIINEYMRSSFPGIFRADPVLSGSVIIESNPSGAEILVGNIGTGQVTPDTVIGLQDENLRITLRLEGFSDTTFYQKLTVNPNVILINLNQVLFGSVIIESNPSGAEILVGNIGTGQVTPDTVIGLQDENLRITLRLEGFSDTTFYQKLTVSPNVILINLNKESVVDKTFKLSLNFPNPFNSWTKIYYSIPHNSTILFLIYDALGRLLGKWEKNNSEGSYDFTWDASAFPSGIYYLRMNTGEFSETRKLILMK
jgi:photosystem II stability/assembly factor-like uncharacterized protein